MCIGYATTFGEGIASSCYSRCRASVAVTQLKCPELTVTDIHTYIHTYIHTNAKRQRITISCLAFRLGNKPLTLRLSYGFASILSGAATPVSALTRHKILLLQCACASVTSPSDFSSSDTAPERRRFTFCSKSCFSDKLRNVLRNASESNLLRKSEYQLQEQINSQNS